MGKILNNLLTIWLVCTLGSIMQEIAIDDNALATQFFTGHIALHYSFQNLMGQGRNPSKNPLENPIRALRWVINKVIHYALAAFLVIRILLNILTPNKLCWLKGTVRCLFGLFAFVFAINYGGDIWTNFTFSGLDPLFKTPGGAEIWNSHKLDNLLV